MHACAGVLMQYYQFSSVHTVCVHACMRACVCDEKFDSFCGSSVHTLSKS